VPSLGNDLVKHLDKIGVAKTLWPNTISGDSIAFSRLEAALWQQAQGLGVTMERNFTVAAHCGQAQNAQWAF
jgi:hypothetical protein